MKTFVIAEIGINHNGSIGNAFRMIDAASNAGCHAAKFQLFTAKNLYPKSAGRLDWHDNVKKYSYNIYEAVESFELPLNWIDKLMAHCKRAGVEFISSVFDEKGMMELIHRGLKKIKLSSYTITNLPLIEVAAKTELPIIISTGGATLGEIEDAVNVIRTFHDNIALLHCSIKYPTELKDCNMGVLDTFKFAFPNILRGYSDHTCEVSDAAVQSIYLGGSVLEKHITLDKNMEGPDHFFALEPQELKKMVSDIADAEVHYTRNKIKIDPVIYGSSEKQTYKHEKYLRDFAYMTLFSKKSIKKGEVISPNDIAILRPGKKEIGLLPRYLKLFQEHRIIAKRDIQIEESLNWDAIL
jgi:N,N'-diacetyllegionaminate synthase